MADRWCHPVGQFRRNQVAWVVTNPRGTFIVEKSRFNSFRARFKCFGLWDIIGDNYDIVAIWTGRDKPTMESLNEWFAQRQRDAEAGKKAAQDVKDAIAKRAHE